MKYVCVFCGSSMGVQPVYKQAAQAMGEALVRRELGLVYGGGNVGLMGTIAVEIITLLGVTNHILTQEKIHWVSPVFLVTITAGTPKNVEKEKHSDLRWFKLSNLPHNITLTTTSAVNFLKQYLSKQ